MLVLAMLRRMGHEPACVDNGRLAVEAVAQGVFDCVVMDMQMPELDGITATRAIRASGASLPIFALSADASPERRRFYENAGLDDFLTKPIDTARLAACLATVRPCEGDGPARQPDFDRDYLDRIEAALGPERFAVLLSMFVAELEQCPASIAAHLAAGRRAEAMAEAHSLKGASASVGAIGVAAAAQVIENLGEATDTAAAAEALRAAAARTLAAFPRPVVSEARHRA